MKWNCNIVKEMYDRVVRRKFGLLCKDDTSNINFIKSYLNRLDCVPIDLTCLKGEELPCSEQSNTNPNITPCNIQISIAYQIVTVGNQVQYIFTSTVTGTNVPYTSNWNIITADWILISEVGNVLTVSPAFTNTSVTTGIVTTVLDENGCQAEYGIEITYLGGCTDPNFENYDPNATFDNGTCQLSILDIATNWSCQPDDSGELCVTVSGGTPPYTVVGTVNGIILISGGILCGILPNGTNFSVYVVDAIGRVTAVQKGIIDCPFDCMFADIKDNDEVICLTDDLGNNTGEATVTVTPSGGNAPYTVVGTINGGIIAPFQYIGGGVWGPGQTVMTGDIVTGTITDVNGCFFNFEIEIYCPVPEPGGGTPSCEDLEGLNISAGLEILSVIQIPFTTLHKVNYRFNYQFTNLGSFGLTIANVAVVQASVFNTTSGNLGNYQPYPTNLCTPFSCISNLIPIYISGPSDTYTVMLSEPCRTSSFTVSAIVKLQVTITTEDEVCTLCFEKEIDASWICESSTSIGDNKFMDNVNC